MEGTRNSVSPNSELGIPSMFATYVETPPFAQPWLHTYSQSPNFFEGLHQPQQDSVYYVHNPYTQASSSVANDDHELDEEHERQPSQVEEPRPEVHRRNPPETGIDLGVELDTSTLIKRTNMYFNIVLHMH
ncbi:hypothetical protein DEO72_LG10g2187 [Vigna unguiculata]|uniref:Uncharacterized protein n=1 Tax=Vigna unguiculata TaxID=3917 RepID=A0A4D6NDY7_VIGUN|nr:hypothetical protein DEO72_LG10g2187 [Vigna unguiculata]